MTFLPIVERELRVAARRRGTYGMRVKIAGAATLVFAACFVGSELNPGLTFGKILFTGLAWLCLCYCLAAGRLMTADCLSGEKRDGTLGLLFLTDLKGLDVVMGKLAATSLDGFYGLLAVFPMLAIPLLAGGMTNGELWRTLLVLVVTFLFSLAIGIFVSAIFRNEQRTMGANLLLLLALAAVPPAIDGIRRLSARGWVPINDAFYYSCPVYAFLQCPDVPFNAAPFHFWWPIVVIFDLTLVLVLLACRIAPRAWQDKPPAPRTRKRQGERRFRWWREGTREKASAFRQRLLGINAYFWLAGRPYLKSAYVWACVLCLICWWIFITLLIGYVDDAANFGIAFLLNGLLKLWFITEAGHQLAADKKSGAFELLLSTPLNTTAIERGQWLALRRQFLKPAVLVIICELLLMFSVRHIHPQDNVKNSIILLAAVLMLVADLVTCGWVAMSEAMTAKTHDRATMKTAAKIMALPWILYGLVCAGTYLWSVFTVYLQNWDPDWDYYLGWWFALGICVDAIFLWRAKRKLRGRFREITQDFAATKSSLVWLRGQSSSRPKLRRLAIAAACLLLIGATTVIYARRAFRGTLPNPVNISLSQNNRVTKIFPVQTGFLFVMPDGSLWRWVRPLAGTVTQPEQIGTNHDWVQASATRSITAALRSDGTLWTWHGKGPEEQPSQVGTDHDWVEIRAGQSCIVARRNNGTLWTNSSQGMTQVGTNHDWKALSPGGYSADVLAVRGDGTLWTWGYFNYNAAGIWLNTNYPTPVQLCQESNWVGTGDGLGTGVRNQGGEWWSFFPFRCLPGPNVAVNTMGQLASSNGAAIAFGPFFNNSWTWGEYELQRDGTIWVTPLSASWPPTPIASAIRFGDRTDWTSMCAGMGTMIATTSDGTLWTWGADYGQQRNYDFYERINLVKAAASNVVSHGSVSSTDDEWNGHQPQKEPRPLFRMTTTKPAP